MIAIEHWGLIDYRIAWRKQNELVQRVQSGDAPNTLVLCHHPTVITMGRNGSDTNVIGDKAEMLSQNIEVIPINRGGDVTLHNPWQLVGYPIFRLRDYMEDLHWFLRELEQCIIELAGEYRIAAKRIEGLTGVWTREEKKLCAIGIHCSRWVVSHGFALNVCNDLSEFDMIIPCGIKEKSITSLQKEVIDFVDFEKVMSQCAQIFLQHF